MSVPPRLLARRVVAAVLVVIAAIPVFGLIDLTTLVGLADPAYRWPVPVNVSWGCLVGVLVGGAYVWLTIARNPLPGLVALGSVTASLLIAAVAGLDSGPLVLAAGIALSGVLLLLLGGPGPTGQSRRLSMRDSLQWPYVLLAAAAAALWLPYALSAFDRSRAGAESDVTLGIEHWPVQGATGVALILGTVVLAVWRPAHPLFPVTLSMSGALIGIAELAYPDRIGATEGLPWAVAVLLWSLAIALAPAESRARSGPSAGRRTIRRTDTGASS